jgi:microsomal epoxide hydrolase
MMMMMLGSFCGESLDLAGEECVDQSWVCADGYSFTPQIQGLILLGTSMDYESSDSRSKGCWDPAAMLTPFFEKWSSPPPPPPAASAGDFVIDEVWCGMVGSVGFGEHGTPEKTAFWTRTLQEVYRGDEGRKKAKMALLNLITRDGLLHRLRDVKCPVHWLQVRLVSFFSPPSFLL